MEVTKSSIKPATISIQRGGRIMVYLSRKMVPIVEKNKNISVLMFRSHYNGKYSGSDIGHYFLLYVKVPYYCPLLPVSNCLHPIARQC